MFSASPDHLPQNNKSAIQIKQDDKFYSRLLSKENSLANPSFRVYYGGVSGSVPFMWESQPGTPKYTFSDTSLPPLTPPPSYYSKISNSKPTKKHSRSAGLLHALFPKMTSLKKTNNVLPSSPSSPSSSSSSLSLSSWSSSPMFLAMSPRKYQRRSRFSTPSSSFDSRADDEEVAAAIGSPTSTLCFAIDGGSIIGKFRGCYGW